LGSPRSGTSLCAGVLKIMGVELGPDLHCDGQNNEIKYFEHSDLRRVNVEILQCLRSNMLDPLPLPSGWINNKKILIYKTKIKHILQRDFRHTHLSGIKDPRILLLLPLYLEIFNELRIKPCLLITKRKQRNIVASLQEWKIPLRKAILIFKKYNQALRMYSNQEAVCHISFDDWFKRPDHVLKKIQDTFSILFTNYEKGRKELEFFIDPAQKHHGTILNTFFRAFKGIATCVSKFLYKISADIKKYFPVYEIMLRWLKKG